MKGNREVWMRAVTGLLVVGVMLLLGGCVDHFRAEYQNVHADSKWEDNTMIKLDDVKAEPVPFMVRHDQLFLLVRSRKHGWFFSEPAEYHEWTPVETGLLLQNHPELEGMIPEGWNNWLRRGFGDDCKPTPRT